MNRAENMYVEELAEVMSLRQPPSDWTSVTEADSFPKQWEAITDESNGQVWHCSRRAAKTYGIRLRTVKRSSERPGWRTLIIHHTRLLGKQQVYETGDAKNPGIREMLRSHRIPEIHHDSTELNITLGNSSFVQIVGCDDANEVGKKLGFLWNDIVIIECQEFDDGLLERLVDKTILPTLIDRGGSLTMEGTPADIEDGVWYKAITEPGFVKHHWTLLDNPFIDRQNIIDAMAIRGFVIDFEHPERNHVLIQREIFGLQVIDPAKLIYPYIPGVNDWPHSGIPFLDASTWRFSMGVDIGGVSEDNDSDACVVWGWRANDPEHSLWEREAWVSKGDSEKFCDEVEATYHRWRPMVAVCADTGGAGAVKALATISKRIKGLKFTPKPTDKELSQRLLADEFRSGRARVNPLGHIARGAKTCIKDKHEVDVMAAARYGHHGVYNFLAEAEPVQPPRDSDAEIKQRRRDQWAKEQGRTRSPWAGDGGWS